MDADLDTLATALYARVDDLLKDPPELLPWRPRVGIAPKLSDAELITLAVLQVLQGFSEEARWLRYADSHLRHLFPYLPGQAEYNKRLRIAIPANHPLTRIEPLPACSVHDASAISAKRVVTSQTILRRAKTMVHSMYSIRMALGMMVHLMVRFTPMSSKPFQAFGAIRTATCESTSQT